MAVEPLMNECMFDYDLYHQLINIKINDVFTVAKNAVGKSLHSIGGRLSTSLFRCKDTERQ
jgi:hypothetical protein